MRRQWTFGRKLAAIIVLLVALTTIIGLIAYLELGAVVTTKDRVIDVEADMLVRAHQMRALAEAKAGGARAFLLTGDEAHVRSMQEDRAALVRALGGLRDAAASGALQRRVETIVQAEASHQRALDSVVEARRQTPRPDEVARRFESEVVPVRARLDAAISDFVQDQERALRAAQQVSTDAARSATRLTAVLVALAVLIAAVLGGWLAKSLRQQIGTAVGQVQTSSAELQAAASQQASGAKEQATAMSEIATTISQLLATSRQITDSARRVAQIAEDTAAAATAGGQTVDEAHESIGGIRRQVDAIVTHMLELGRKSQQIGTVLDIVSELAEQTNILAINATIEAAGAGDAGRRFGVVAEEIRKLADRVAGSTKEIRGLIDDVRGAVNTTVMATETGSKAVDAGSRQFGHVTASFRQIADLVATTREAAREIELSIKQQMTAVEQVNLAIASIAQASRQTEATTSQTQQTASQLAGLSRDLLKLIRPEQAA